MSQAVIATRHLSRRFGDTVAVNDLELAVPEGTVTAFLGPNGAGKTTTIRMILGLLRPDSGDVCLFGKPLVSDRQQLLAKVGALVESPSLYGHLSGRDNLELTRRLLALPPSRTDQVLRIVDLLDAAQRPVAQYSLGMRQRLGLALALLGEPRLLILDEPTNGLDPAGIREIRDLIRGLPRDQGVSVFLSSHWLGEVQQIAQHVAIAQRGSLVFQGPLEELQAERRATLEIGVDRPAEAAECLASAGWQVLECDSTLRVDASGNEAAEQLCQALVHAGFRVHRLIEHTPDLESAFFELTTNSDSQATQETPPC